MATNVIMPALEMAQETGKVLRWLKKEGETVAKGEPIMEIETSRIDRYELLIRLEGDNGEIIPPNDFLQRIGKGTSVMQNLCTMRTCYELGVYCGANLLPAHDSILGRNHTG